MGEQKQFEKCACMRPHMEVIERLVTATATPVIPKQFNRRTKTKKSTPAHAPNDVAATAADDNHPTTANYPKRRSMRKKDGECIQQTANQHEQHASLPTSSGVCSGGGAGSGATSCSTSS